VPKKEGASGASRLVPAVRGKGGRDGMSRGFGIVER
jgi:hypothetical protein